MALIDLSGQELPDTFTALGDADALPEGDVLVSLSRWLSEREALTARTGAVGVQLTGEDDPTRLAGALDGLALVAVYFPKFADGRGYSIARLVRERLGWSGALRATGEVLRDQAFYLKRCGFSELEIPQGRSAAYTAEGLKDFSVVYQGASDGTVPIYRQPGHGS